MWPWLRFQPPAASRTEYANVLSEHRAGDGSGKNNGGAECFHFRHGVFPHSNREKIPTWEGRSAASTEREIRTTLTVHSTDPGSASRGIGRIGKSGNPTRWIVTLIARPNIAA
jgi:hypothetical protein